MITEGDWLMQVYLKMAFKTEVAVYFGISGKIVPVVIF